jgi:Domain of unknown function (DUF4832)/Domain of unknown function (DUF4874)
MILLTKIAQYFITGSLFITLSLWLPNIVCAQSVDISPNNSAQATLVTSNPVQLQNLSNQVGELSIVIDTSRGGWELAIPYTSDISGDNGGKGQIDWNTITIAHDCNDLNVRYEVADGPMFTPDGFRYNLAVDVDNNPMTGYRGIGKQLSIGADVLIQGGQNKVTTFKFIGADQQAWGWQEINFYPISDEAKAGGGRDIDYRISISDLDVFGTGVTSFDWVAWADYSTAILDFYPDTGNLGDAGNFNTYTFNYTPRTEGIANPERGFFESTQTRSSKYTPVNLADLQCYRQNEGISLIHRDFYLENFVNSDISQQYLDMMQVDFDKIRQAGLKVIPRFAYSESAGLNLTPPYGDASKERILSHLNQLSNVLRKNSDVIAVMQAGFIGLWGEWWYSDHFQPDADWSDRADILYGILNVLPATRMVQLRTPRSKQNIFSDITPVDLVTAHKGSDRARTGHHNDCFVSSMSDGGTYVNTSTEYSYLEEETKWVPMGGETCDHNSLADRDPVRLECATALDELARFHWSFLNLDWYRPTLRKWLDDGCFSEIERRLGYQLMFLQGTYNDQIKPGDLFIFSLQLKNEGFSAPFNPRAVELILRRTDGSTYTFKLPNDPRFWQPGKIHTITDQIKIPMDFPAGNYEVLLNLPDPEPMLHQRPEYSIRLANENIWEAATGYNRLNHTLIVEPPVYYPALIGITVGKYDWGSLASFKVADTDTYDIQSRPDAGGRVTDWYATTTIINRPAIISALSLSYTGQYSIKNILQSLSLYNYKTAKWDLLDNRTVGNTDDVTVSAVINLTPDNYVSSKGEMKVRVRGFHPSRDFKCWANALSWTVH